MTSDPAAVDETYVKNRAAVLDGSPGTPVIYQVDLTQADGYFVAQQIRLRDKDVILVTTAEATQFLKIMQVVRSITGAYYDITRSSNY
jgi:polysaccharide export outer membrane protein